MRRKGHLLHFAQESIQRLRYLRTSPSSTGVMVASWTERLQLHDICTYTEASHILQGSTSPEPFEVSVGKARASLSIDGRRVRSFAVRRVDVLTRAVAEDLAEEARRSRRPIMITFERSSPEARAYLRERRASYAAADGELFLYAPPVYVERPPRRKVVPVGAPPAAPFANRASRVPRWLLLHAD